MTEETKHTAGLCEVYDNGEVIYISSLYAET